MILQPTDWVWFTYMNDTQFCRFDTIHPELQYSISSLYGRRHKATYLMFNPDEKLDIHLILPKEGENYVEKLQILTDAHKGSKISILRLPGGDHWLHGEMPKFGPLDALNEDLGIQGKKELSLKYVDWLSKFIIKPIQLKEKLEEKPMKVKKFLIELNKYKDKKITSEKEGVLITYKNTYPTSPKDILQTLESMYVNSNSQWDMLHSVLTIEDGSYIIGSGHCEYTRERYNILAKDKGLLLEIDVTKLNTQKLFFTERISTVSDEVKTGELYIRVPLISNMKNVIKYYQQKWPNKNYTLDRKTIKKKLSERSQKLADLPKLGETPAKELRKVCYKHKESTVIFRGSYVNAKKHVDSGNYEFVSKTAWKRQILDNNDKLISQREANISNIIHSPLGRDLREKKNKREETKASKEKIRYKKLMEKYARRNGQRKPGDVERKLQSDKDKKVYAEKCKFDKKKRISHPVSRSYETVIIGKKGNTLPPLFIKATSIEHATKQLNVILKQKKAKSGKLTNVRDWTKQTGNKRPKKD